MPRTCEAQYWERVYPHVIFEVEAEVNEAVERLVEAKRPLAAFHAVHIDWSKVETSRLKRLLQAVGNGVPGDELRFFACQSTTSARLLRA